MLCRWAHCRHQATESERCTIAIDGIVWVMPMFSVEISSTIPLHVADPGIPAIEILEEG